MLGPKVQIDEAEPAMASLVRAALAKRIIEMAHRPGVDMQKLRDDAIAYVKNNPLWPSVTLEGPAVTQRRPWIRFRGWGAVGDSQKGPEEFDECPRGLSAAPEEVRTSRRRHTD